MLCTACWLPHVLIRLLSLWAYRWMSLSLCAWLPDNHVFWIPKREAKAPPMWPEQHLLKESGSLHSFPNWLTDYCAYETLCYYNSIWGLAYSWSFLYEIKAKSGSQYSSGAISGRNQSLKQYSRFIPSTRKAPAACLGWASSDLNTSSSLLSGNELA